MNEKKILTLKYNFSFSIAVIEKCLNLPQDKIIQEIVNSELLGRGGAWFPTGKKWLFVKQASSDEKYIVCNAEEGEPYTFKDKFLIKNFPYKIIDGIVIAAIALKSHKGFICINEKYKEEKRELEKIIKFYRRNLFSKIKFDIQVIESNGTYITGEETSLLNFLEGKRPTPRLKPPYPPQYGLFEKPTLINNAETFAFIPQIIYYGSKWFKTFGCKGSYGTKLICLSGDLVKKGVYEIELGKFTLKEILVNFGKVKNVHKIAAVLPSATSRFVFPDKLNLRYDYQTFIQHKIPIGTGGIIVFSKNTDLLKKTTNLMKFFMEESCGYCIPCRIGTKRVYEMLLNKNKDSSLLYELCLTIKETSRCAFGQSCVEPILSLIEEKKW